MTEPDHAGRWQRLRHTDPTLAIVTITACMHLVRRAPLDTFALDSRLVNRPVRLSGQTVMRDRVG